jgi:hypothetical protein
MEITGILRRALKSVFKGKRPYHDTTQNETHLLSTGRHQEQRKEQSRNLKGSIVVKRKRLEIFQPSIRMKRKWF